MFIYNLFLDFVELILKLISHLIRPFLNCLSYIIFILGISIVLFLGFSNAADYDSIVSMIFSLVLVLGVCAFAVCILMYISSIIMSLVHYVLNILSFVFDRFSSFVGRINDNLIDHFYNKSSNNIITKLLSVIQDVNYYFCRYLYMSGLIGLPFLINLINNIAIKYLDYNPHIPSSLIDYIIGVNNIQYNSSSRFGLLFGLIASIIFTIAVYILPISVYIYCLYKASLSLSKYFKVKRLFFKFKIFNGELDTDSLDTFLYLVFYDLDVSVNGRKIKYCPDIDIAYNSAEELFKNRNNMKREKSSSNFSNNGYKQSYYYSNQTDNTYDNNSNNSYYNHNTYYDDASNTKYNNNDYDNLKRETGDEMLQNALNTFGISMDSLISMSYDELRSLRAKLIKNAHPDNGGTHQDAVNINGYYTELKNLKDRYNAA